MLTASQVTTVAYMDGQAGEVLCEACARDAHSPQALYRADSGLSDSITPLCRYSIGEMAAEASNAVIDYLADEHGPAEYEWAGGDDGAGYRFEDGTWINEEAEEVSPPVPCDECGRDLVRA